MTRLAIFLLVSAAAAKAAPQGVVTTNFLPSRDMVAMRNPLTGHGAAVGGMCEGFDQLAGAIARHRKKFPLMPDLNAITAKIKAQPGGEKYLQELMNCVTDLALSKGGVNLELAKGGRMGDALGEDIVRRMQRTGEAQDIMFMQSDGIYHRMKVYGAAGQRGNWELKVADSNYANDPRFTTQNVADGVTMRYLPGRGGGPGVWQKFSDGKPTETYRRGGDLVLVHHVDDRQFVNLLIAGMNRTPLHLIEERFKVGRHRVATKPLPSHDAAMGRDVKAGGVWIRFNPSLAYSTASESQLKDVSERIAKFLEGEESAAQVIRVQQREVGLELVSLATLKPGQSIGGLARIRGFVAKPDGSVFLAGLKGPSPLMADDLIFALRTIYRDGKAPFISLDPDPTDFSRAQRVRIGEVDEDLRNSGFIKGMIDADYVMKKINLGRLKPKMTGFKSWVQMMEEHKAQGNVRMWMEPAPPPLADAMLYQTPAGATAVFFETDVLTLSERMLMAQDLAPQTGPLDTTSDAAATELTNSFDELAAEYPEYRRLQGLFDLAKACMSMRRLDVKSPEINRLLTLAPTQVQIPKTYPGIGPDQLASGSVVSGGAVARARFEPVAAIWTESLGPLIEAAGSRPQARITLPTSVTVPEARLAAQTADAFIRDAKEMYLAGDAEGALTKIGAVAEFLPSNETKILHAVTLVALGRAEEGITILGSLPEQNLMARVIRGVALADAGHTEKALADAKVLEERAPFDPHALAMACIIRSMCVDFDGAARDLAAARRLSPTSQLLEPIAIQLRIHKGLGIEGAKRRMAAVRKLPFSFRQRMLVSATDPKQAVELSKSILEELDSGKLVAPPNLYIRERVETGLAVRLVQAGSAEEAKALAAKQVEKNPTWTSARYLRALIGFWTGTPASSIVDDLEASRKGGDDPVMDDIRAESGAPNPVLNGALTMIFDPTRPVADRAVIADWLATAGPPVEARFAKSMLGFPGADVTQVLRTRGAEGLGAGGTTTSVRLARMTPVDLDARYATFISGLGLVQIALSRPDLDVATTRELRLKALRMMRSPGPAMVPEGEQMVRSATGMLCMSSILRVVMDPSSTHFQAMRRSGEEANKLLKADPAKVKRADVVTFVKGFTQHMRTFWEATKSGINAELDAIGPSNAEQRDRLELMTTWMWLTMGEQGRDPSKELEIRFPYLPTTPEGKELRAVMDKIKGSQIGALTESELWERVVSQLKTRQEADDFEGALRLLCEMSSKPSPRLLMHWLQIQVVARRLE